MTDHMEAEIIDAPGALVPATTSEIIAAQSHALTWSREQISLLKATVAKDTTDAELDLFLHVCSRTGLDPFAKQIYAIKRGGKLTIQTSIDGFRLIAERSRRYVGQVGPQWCAKDGRWLDVWLSDAPPAAARVGALREGYAEPLWGTALWREFAPHDLKAPGSSMWVRMGAHQLAKCAEALALRRAFPQELGGLYTPDEIRPSASAPPPAIEAPRASPGLRARVDAVKKALGEKNTVAGIGQVWNRGEELRLALHEDAPELETELAEFYAGELRRIGGPL